MEVNELPLGEDLRQRGDSDTGHSLLSTVTLPTKGTGTHMYQTGMPEAQKGKEVCPRLHSGEESGREPRALSRGPGHMEINKGITLARCGTGMTAGGHLDSNTAGLGGGLGEHMDHSEGL